MRFLLLALGLLLPQLGQAQLLNSFEDGYYLLAGSQLALPGKLKLQNDQRLAVKTAEGQTLKFEPLDVTSFRIGTRKYTTARGMHLIYSIGGIEVGPVFVEQLDSGRVLLMRLNYMGGNTNSVFISSYVLRRMPDGPDAAAQAAPYTNGGKHFREVVRPYFVGRPDLLKYLDSKRINVDNLPAAIRALNQNLPFSPSAASSSD